MADDLVQKIRAFLQQSYDPRGGLHARKLLRETVMPEIERMQFLIGVLQSRSNELAELRERIEKAPVAETWETDWGGRAPNSLVADVPAAIGEGKRVRLLVEE